MSSHEYAHIPCNPSEHDRRGGLFPKRPYVSAEERQEIKHLTSKVWIALAFCVFMILTWGTLMRTIHFHGKEVQRAETAAANRG